MKNIYKLKLIAFVIVLICCQSVSAVQTIAIPKRSEILTTLDKNHPRLMLKDSELQKLKQLYKTDKTLQRYIADSLSQADKYMLKRTLIYRKKGKRLLKVSRECLRRVYALGLAYRWTGNEKYAEKAKEELLAVSNFKDWNPMHFLDVAEMSHAVGLGYDWFYHYLDDQSRQKIKTAIIQYGMKPGLQAYGGAGSMPGNKDLVSGWWTGSSFNWNIVCNNGLIVGALAVAETDPEYAERIISHALASMPKALASYAPEGAWMEGPGYWDYATRYLAYGLSALDTALGKDFGLSQFEGISNAGFFPIHMTGPTDLIFNFADCDDDEERVPMPAMFWLAKKFDNQFIADDEHFLLTDERAKPQHVVWYLPPSSKPLSRKLDRYFHGRVETAFFRSTWDDDDALFVGIKAGFNQVDHGHLDLGTFVMDALDVRWVYDLGKDDYDLPGYWRRGKGQKRWTYYRLRSESHNVPVINNQNQDELAEAKFIKFNPDKSSPFVTIDLTTAYKDFAQKVTRGLKMIQNRRAVLVQDEFEIQKPCRIAWGLTTEAAIVTDKKTAELTLEGKKLIAKILSPARAKFTVRSAEQAPPQEDNEDVSRLMVLTPRAEGNVRIAVLLSPVWPDGHVETTELKPLSQW
ncbi:MAG: DUF4962 domain-containing protein [Planctomycetes bacterium]|nr:DUF4962 domain-containing protein [Planctomycetota bacterium]